jgi:hypothetical protein
MRVTRIPYLLDQEGGSFFGNLWDGIKKAARWVVDNKAISKTANALGFNNVGAAAGALGLGARRLKPSIDRAGRQHGGAMWDNFKRAYGWVADKAKKAHDFAKEKKIVSTVLRQVGQPKAAAVARMYGYGKRKRRVPRQRGGAFNPRDSTSRPGILGV